MILNLYSYSRGYNDLMVMSMIALMIAVIPIAIEVADVSDAAITIALFSPYSQEKVKITTLLSDYHHAP